MEKRKTSIEFSDKELDEILGLMDNGEFETIQDAIASAVKAALGKDETSKYYLGSVDKWHKKDW